MSSLVKTKESELENLADLYRGPQRLPDGLKLLPTEAAVVLRNGRVAEVRRAGRYKRLLTRDRLPLTGELQAYLFHVGEMGTTVEVPRVPVTDGFHVDWTIHLGLKWAGGDETLDAVVRRYKPSEFALRLAEELRSTVTAVVRRAAMLASHAEVEREAEFERLFRGGEKLLGGLLEITEITRAVPRFDPVVVAESQEQKEFKLAQSRLAREQDLAEANAIGQRKIRVLQAQTDHAVREIEEGGRGQIAARVAAELGVPAWWVYNPDAHRAEIAAHRDMLVKLLGEYGADFGHVADRFGLEREDFLRIFAGFQRGVITVAETAGSQAEGRTSPPGLAATDPQPVLANSEALRALLSRHGHERDIAGTSLFQDGQTVRGVVVAQDVGSVRAKYDSLAQEVAVETGSSTAELVIVPFRDTTAELITTMAECITAEAGLTPEIELIREGEQYLLTSPDHEVLLLSGWTDPIGLAFKPRLELAVRCF